LVPVMTVNRPAADSPAGGMTGASGTVQIPLGELADIKIVKGPTAIKKRRRTLTSYVFIDYSGSDVGGYVDAARKRRPPSGYLKDTGFPGAVNTNISLTLMRD